MKKMHGVLIALLLVSIVAAIDLRPQITIEFTETIDVPTLVTTFKNASNIDFPITLVDQSDPQDKIFIFQPDNDLPEGLYTITATANDLSGNPGDTISFTFAIAIPNLLITLKQPPVGVAQGSPLNFTIETDRTAECKYSFLDQQFENMPLTFPITDGFTHRNPTSTNVGNLNIKCKDEFGKVFSKQQTIAVDSSGPSITRKFAEPVTQIPIATNLEVDTNEASVCRYTTISTQNFDNMLDFPNFNETEESSYTLTHSQPLDASDLINGQLNRFFFICKNKAGLQSVKDILDISVFTNATATIAVNAPTGFIEDSTPTFDVTTNKDATCRVADNSALTNADVMSGTERTHSVTLNPAISEGAFTYTIECVFASEGAITTTTSFTLDTTPPVFLFVNMTTDLDDNSKTFVDDELCGEWEAEDNVSGIERYTYYLFRDESPDALIESGTTSDTDECVDHDGNNSEKYFFTVSATNRAGLVSVNTTSSTITIDTSLTPASCTNGIRDANETGKDCGGICRRKCGLGITCNRDRDCGTNYCGPDGKCIGAKCTDNVRNAFETDIDCGSTCPKCSVGKTCKIGSDCTTNNCDQITNTCTVIEDSCSNNKLDALETDIDCGGTCPLCRLGDKCKANTDCISSTTCQSGKCQTPNEDTDGDGIKDQQDNCPNDENADQGDVDGDAIGDVCDEDNDNDGLPDSFEQRYFDCLTCANPNDDSDGDGLTNIQEFQLYDGLNPTSADSDGDGVGDKEEIDAGSDPLDPNSKPSSSTLWIIIAVVIAVALAGGAGFYYFKVMKKKPRRRPQPARTPPQRAPTPQQPRPTPPTQQRPPPPRPTPTPQKAPAKAPQPTKKIDKGDIFQRLSDITKTERKETVDKYIKNIELTDKDLKKRINTLRKELKE